MEDVIVHKVVRELNSSARKKTDLEIFPQDVCPGMRRTIPVFRGPKIVDPGERSITTRPAWRVEMGQRYRLPSPAPSRSKGGQKSEEVDVNKLTDDDRVSMKIVCEFVAGYFQQTVENLMKGRLRECVRSRYVAFYVLQKGLGFSPPGISLYFDDDCSTFRYGMKIVIKNMREDRSFSDLVETVIKGAKGEVQAFRC